MMTFIDCYIRHRRALATVVLNDLTIIFKIKQFPVKHLSLEKCAKTADVHDRYSFFKIIYIYIYIFHCANKLFLRQHRYYRQMVRALRDKGASYCNLLHSVLSLLCVLYIYIYIYIYNIFDTGICTLLLQTRGISERYLSYEKQWKSYSLPTTLIRSSASASDLTRKILPSTFFRFAIDNNAENLLADILILLQSFIILGPA